MNGYLFFYGCHGVLSGRLARLTGLRFRQFRRRITVTQWAAQNTMTIGADGEVMHSLHADKSGTVTVNLLKTSPTNKTVAGV